MTKYLKAQGAQVGDEVCLSKDVHGGLHIKCLNKTAIQEDDVLKLSGGWKVISIKTR